MNQDEQQHEQCTGSLEEFHQRTDIGFRRFQRPFQGHGFLSSARLAHDQTDDDGKQREQRTDIIGDRPVGPRRYHQCYGTGGCRTDPPAILRHARADTELLGLEQFDAIGIDHHVKGSTCDADHDGGDRDSGDILGRIQRAEIDYRCHGQSRGHNQPGQALTNAADDRQFHNVDDRCPQPFEIIGEKGQCKGSNGRFFNPCLGQTCCQCRGDHRQRERRRDAKK